jgi:predicted ABC-type ATPase
MGREIVFISGAPGSGKSTLAGQLAEALQMNLIGKDLIKEALWDVFDPPAGDLEWSRRLGASAMEVIWTLATQSRRAVLEANFRPHSAYEKSKLSGLSANLVEVHCVCPPELARERYERRAAQSTHHPAHVTPTLDPVLLAEFDQPVGLGTVIEVNTTVAVNIEDLTRTILAELARP